MIAIISPNKKSYSETFIRSHIDELPVGRKVLYGLPSYIGGFYPYFLEDGRRLLPMPLFYTSIAFQSLPLLYQKYSNSMNFFAHYINTRALSYYLKKNKIKAVLAEYGPTGLAVIEACQKVGVPLIIHFHGYDAYDKKILNKYGNEYRKYLPQADAIIAVSKDMYNKLLSIGSCPEKLHYNPYGVDCSLFSEAEPNLNPPLFVSVGRFVDKKAPYLTLLAFSKVAKISAESKMVMVGDGYLQETCKNLARVLKIEDKIDFTGPLPHKEVAKIMKRSRAFVQHSIVTSYGDSEGTPLGILEAGACGLPVVATRHGGIKDSVIHEHTGFLVDEGDIEGMADYMITLAKDSELSAAMGREAREHICANFSMEKSISNLWQIINHAIA
jgi:glycosyltransferase involved in cell wall biosynthesis